MSYYIIDTGSPGERDGSHSAIGPFKNREAAELWLIEDCADTYRNADNSLRELADDVPWAEPHHIVKVEVTVRPVPHAAIRVRLEPINPKK